MGSWVGVMVEVANGDRPCELTEEAGVTASGRATGCDRMGECTAFWLEGASAVGTKSSGKRRSLGDLSLAAAEASGIRAPYRKRRQMEAVQRAGS